MVITLIMISYISTTTNLYMSITKVQSKNAHLQEDNKNVHIVFVISKTIWYYYT